MMAADQSKALETAERLESQASRSGTDAALMLEAAEHLRSLTQALERSQAKSRLTLDAVLAGLKSTWAEALPGHEVPDEDGLHALARALYAHLKAPAMNGSVLKTTHAAYLKLLDAAASYGIERGQTHPIMARLAREGLAQFERRRWRITDKGRAWLVSNIPNYQPPPTP